MPLGSGSLVIADRNTDQRPFNCAMGVLGCRCLLRCITRGFCSGQTAERQRINWRLALIGRARLLHDNGELNIAAWEEPL